MTEQQEISTRYEPGKVEKKWYDFWKESGFFHAAPSSDRPPYSIVIPPPNVTGRLHMGHALNNTLQDILARWKRMEGFNVLWLPGTDHAGIATQNVVERELLKEGISRHDLGREKMVEKIWEWREKYGNAILGQLMAMGCSCDWDRTRFTLDDGLSKAVRTVFVKLYHEKLLYRGNYLVNWCPRCHTAISDDEVEYEDRNSHLWQLKYPLEEPFTNSAGETIDHLVIATTRPETMLGDTAVAVHPEDDRYTELIGKNVLLPLVNRAIPIVADKVIDREFGTGALKVTPAHDIVDYEIGKRHGLEEINIFTPEATINENGGDYAGMDRYKARKAVVRDLDRQGFLLKEEEHTNRVGICYRCQTDIEPYLSRQWFVKMKPLMVEPIAAVKDGRIRFIPSQWDKTYFAWVENVRDWCISRQIWWGHRIPVWYCQDCNFENVSEVDPTQCEKCGSENIQQDEDVLDTWFSSALWPFSTMGWPDNTDEVKSFYPTSALITGHDIIYFWVARMIMMGLKFMDDVPFHDVYITALVRDQHGKKMSKSSGNVVDPLVLIDAYGADAMRFTLAIMAAQGRNVNLDEKRIEGYRNFTNKLWNAARLVLSEPYDGELAIPETLNWQDRWVLSRLQRAIKTARLGLEEYRFNDAAQVLYEFLWHEYCDWYLELIKPRLQKKSGEEYEAVVACARYVLENVLRLLHPFIPFITEEIWQEVKGNKVDKDASIMLAEYPQVDETLLDECLEAEMEIFQNYIYALRNIRGELTIPPKQAMEVSFISSEENDFLSRRYADIVTIANTSTELVISADAEVPTASSVAVVGNTKVVVAWPDDVADREKKRLSGKVDNLKGYVVGLNKKLGNDKFVNHAPPEVVEKERGKLAAAEQELATLEERLTAL